MNKPRGICLISVPKSGTMYLSRYLARLTGDGVVFGLEAQSEPELLACLDGRWHPAVHAALAAGSPDLPMMCKRFAQMLMRNRERATHCDRPRILSDHGFTSFLQFLIHPAQTQIRDPGQIIEWACQQGLAPVFLHRDLRGVANSLVHFLASRKSYLLNLHSTEAAAQLVTELYAPVLAAQIRMWRAREADSRLLTVSYEALLEDPGSCIAAICKHGNLHLPADQVSPAPLSYCSWTFRSGKATWTDTFTAPQQAALQALLSAREQSA